MITVHLIANAHLDPVWLWPWEEGLDEALATFKSAADRCDEYSELIFCRGESWLYEKLERYDPDLFARIQTLVERSQWHITGGQYLQPDLNAPIGESHIRQFTRGRRYFEDRFGITPCIAFNVDSFGHPATFPDLTAGLGLKGYVIQRPKSFQKALPQHFIWNGKTASLPVFKMSAPYTSMTIAELEAAIEMALLHKVEGQSHTMCFFGVGNHGGGPTKAQIEWILSRTQYRKDVKLIFSTPEAFFQAAKAEQSTLAHVSGDLQSCFPGCYSVMHDIHQEQRHGELRALQAEAMSQLFSASDTLASDRKDRLGAAWDDLLFNAFHDIVAGTAVARAWPSVRALYGRAQITCEEIISETSRIWARRTLPPRNAHQHVFINPSETDFEGLMEIEPWLEDYSNWDDRWIADATGTAVPHQSTQPEANIRSRLIVPVQILAGGHTVYTIESTPPPETDSPSDLWASPYRLRNRDLDIELGRGGVKAIRWHGREMLGPDGLALHLREDSQDCWGMYGDSHDDPIIDRWDTTQWELEDQGPLRARCRLDGRLGTSRVQMMITLDSETSGVSLELSINMDERNRLIQMPLHWPSESRHHLDGGPCEPGTEGVILRNSGTTSEHSFQEFSLARFDDSHDAAVLTQDCYSVSHRSDQSIFTLLRAPIMASAGNKPIVHFGRDTHTDQGIHHFRFDLVFGEMLSPSALRASARMIATPPIHFDYYEGMDRPLPLAAGHTPPNSMTSRVEPGKVHKSSVNRE